VGVPWCCFVGLFGWVVLVVVWYLGAGNCGVKVCVHAVCWVVGGYCVCGW